MSIDFEYKVMWCPVCNQGWIKIVKDEIANEIYLCCSECETEWDKYEDIKNNKGTHGKYGLIIKPTDEEIVKKGWERYIMK